MSEPQSSSRPSADRRPFPWSEPGILVGVDGSAAALTALRYAVDIAPKLGHPVHALVVWDYPTLEWSDGVGWYYPGTYASLEGAAEEIASDAASSVFPSDTPDWFSSSTMNGRAARELVDASKDAAMLVVGTRGHGELTGLLLGSVSAACAAHAHCPVLIVRND
ncbi:universal stress protein [Microbacterium sp. LWS13-1.2]|uniref:Universal stress protein n=1 Tax=Microbacterium sp. LWS13-1.2 TaxID=3135264 RepID=A0AAU6SA12_9MICO